MGLYHYTGALAYKRWGDLAICAFTFGCGVDLSHFGSGFIGSTWRTDADVAILKQHLAQLDDDVFFYGRFVREDKSWFASVVGIALLNIKTIFLRAITKLQMHVRIESKCFRL